MKDDSTLLITAAESMGFINYSLHDEKLGVFVETGSRRGDGGYNWNPLKSSSDAMKLMAKYRIIIDPTMLNRVYATQSLYGINIMHWYDDDDVEKAIRYSIVKAVCEIVELAKIEQK